MARFMQPEDNAERLTSIPEDIPILPLRNTVAYPFSVLPLAVGMPRSVKLIEEALQGKRLIGLVAMKDSSVEEPLPGQVYEVGTVARIQRVQRAPDTGLQVIVEGMERFRVVEWLEPRPYLQARVLLNPETVDPGVELDALEHSLRDLARDVIALSPNIPDEAGKFLDQIQGARHLAYLVASNIGLETGEGQRLLELDSLREKLRTLISHLSREREVLKLGKKIQTDAREEIDKAQREFYLRQQMKAIRKELGESEDSQSDSDEYDERLAGADLPEEALKEARRELKRLRGMSPQSAEYSVIKTYLDWLLELPWNVRSEDQLDIGHARRVLDEDHYDLQDVKDRIIEYLAVRKLVRERDPDRIREQDHAAAGTAMGAILCFVGPPGVGKTSLGQSIARALGRQFTRMSLGGMRDEAEIRGHRRTYIGAMPGRIIQASNGRAPATRSSCWTRWTRSASDWRGDPSSALLEVLDPAQNHAFRDHYLDVDFDLSDVMFITTANQLETIPPPLRDRMEIIPLDGYTEYEKVRIAQGYLHSAADQGERACGRRRSIFTEEALHKIVRDYTREAGVRNLERQIGTICRKVAVRIAGRGVGSAIEVTPEQVREYLKKEKFESELSEAIEIPGIATGLAVTAVGGDILFIEATRMKGSGKLTLTGQLGDVMRESAQIALQLRALPRPRQLGVDPDVSSQTDIHIHVPAGAIPKDGPSAGITMVTAVASLLSGRPVRSDVGMTGEVTLRGRVLPVGGIKMKVLAAHRAGLRTVILPRRNEADLEELPADVKDSLRFVHIDRIDEALEIALVPVESETSLEREVPGEELPWQPGFLRA